MLLLASGLFTSGLLASGPLPPPKPPCSALALSSRRAVLRSECATGGTFAATIELGEGDGTVVHEFQPYFSSSTLITMRYPVPYTLEAEPLQGVIKVTDTGDGLIEGDVLRAFSTLQLRCDAAAREQRDACSHLVKRGGHVYAGTTRPRASACMARGSSARQTKTNAAARGSGGGRYRGWGWARSILRSSHGVASSCREASSKTSALAIAAHCSNWSLARGCRSGPRGAPHGLGAGERL